MGFKPIAMVKVLKAIPRVPDLIKSVKVKIVLL
nr:hypothetical protein [Mucilaginibacter sp. FT3.2]